MCFCFVELKSVFFCCVEQKIRYKKIRYLRACFFAAFFWTEVDSKKKDNKTKTSVTGLRQREIDINVHWEPCPLGNRVPPKKVKRPKNENSAADNATDRQREIDI